MKIAIRNGVFETNSSSTHTLTLVPKAEYDSEKEEFKHFRTLTDKHDKLLMACGCCSEIFIEEKEIARYASWGDECEIERKKEYDEIKDALANGFGNEIYISHNNLYYELAMDFIVRVYCELTGDDRDKTYAEMDKINNSGRACHMKFFWEGSLYDPEYDYYLITELFVGDEADILANIRNYFNDDNLLCYSERYGGCRSTF